MTKEKRFFIYARKSTDDKSRQVRSVPDQIAELQEMARKGGFSVVRIFEEKQTAKVPGRPVFNDMLARIERGEAEGIMAWHPDRLARNSVDGGRIIYLVDTKKIADLKFPTFIFDPTPSGKFMLSIMFGQSKYYVDNLSENIRRGHRQKLRNGIWPQKAPIGYLNDPLTRTIVPDPLRGLLVRKTFEIYADDFTLDQITETINDLGMTSRQTHRGFSRTQYHRLLRNPIYYGLIRHSGEFFEGKHEPLVSKSLFDRVQDVIRNKRKPRTKRQIKPYLYRRLFRCGECGGFITMETQKGHNYLRCTKKKGPCTQGYLREELIGEQVASKLQFLAVPKDWIWSMLQELQSSQQSETIQRELQQIDVQAKLAEVSNKLERLTSAYVENVLSLDEYKNAKAKVVDEQIRLKEKA
ncbi:MAG TPA: recombinase family protein, partial [Tepidisphaeraceae bacterium]|nr:recombinase family protein [Tepidisphaeraceae bacterium]